MKRLLWSVISLALVFSLAVGEATAISADGTPQKKAARRRARSKAAAAKQQAQHQAAMERLAAAEQHAQAAEQRAREAEAAAARAASDAKAAQDQAAQAMEAARRANDALARVQESLGRVERTSSRATEDVAALRKTDEQLTADVKAVRTAEEATAKKVTTVAQQTEGAVTSTSKFPVKIYGNILFNANFLDRGANNNDIPLFPQKRGTSADQNHQNVNLTLRQTRFGLRYDGKFSDAKLTGVFEFDLLGGKPAFANGVNFDIFRLRLAYGRIDWAKDSFEAGQDWAVFSPLNPTTLASYAIPGFSTSGNLWNRFPQIRYEHREGEKSKFIFTTAILDPDAGDNAGNPATRVIGLGERGSLPAFEARLGFTTPSHGKESSGGVSGHYSRLLGVAGNPAGTTVRSPIDSYGVSGDVNAWLSSGFRVTGEVFHGRALGIFSGDIAQAAVVLAGRARGINSTGGWVELHGEAPTGYEGPWKKFSVNAGYGIEDNRDRDLLVGLRKRNQTFLVNSQYKLSPQVTFALEYRHVWTDFFNQPTADHRLNWANIAFLYSF